VGAQTEALGKLKEKMDMQWTKTKDWGKNAHILRKKISPVRDNTCSTFPTLLVASIRYFTVSSSAITSLKLMQPTVSRSSSLEIDSMAHLSFLFFMSFFSLYQLMSGLGLPIALHWSSMGAP
jgi:hypothetical protein